MASQFCYYRLVLINCICITCLLVPQLTSADDQVQRELDLLRKEVDQLKRNQSQILASLKSLASQSAHYIQSTDKSDTEQPGRVFSLEGVTFTGDTNAPIIVVEFTDYQCPFCRRHAKTTLPLLVEHYIKTGRVRYGVSEFPVESLHPNAPVLSEAALCARDQGKYWEMRDQLMLSDGKSVEPEELTGLARSIGMSIPEFEMCLSSQAHAERIRANLAQRNHAGITGTPFFLMGRSDSIEDGAMLVSVSLKGAQPYPIFKQSIEMVSKESMR